MMDYHCWNDICELYKLFLFYIYIIKMIISTILPIFFLYFVLLSGYCSELLNCKLQKLMDSLIFFRHFLIFAAIYIFTFVLNWYTFDSLQISHIETKNYIEDEEEDDEEKVIITKEFNLNMLLTWFYQSIVIYVIFLITTKVEVFQFMVFFIILIICIILQLILKSITTKKYSEDINKKLFINKSDYNSDNSKNVITLHNAISYIYLFSILIILHGLYQYYNRQRREHHKNWSIIKFIFGTSKKGKECTNL